MSAYLRLVFMIVDGHEQNQASLIAILRADAPAARHRQRVIEDVLIACRRHSHNGKFNIVLVS